jgi:hypothetical protein
VARGPFNLNCTSNKSISSVINEIQKSLKTLKITFDKNNALFECSKQGIGWTIEVCRLEDLNEILLVKFRKTAGEM